MTELALHILDIVQNSISAKATLIEIEVDENTVNDTMNINIRDNGVGMDAQTLVKASEPFFTSRTTRKVGMGLALLKQAAEQCNGSFALTSEPGKGTMVKVTFGLTHFDRQPMGDIAGVMVLLVASNPTLHFRYRHSTHKGEYVFDTDEINEALDGAPIVNAEIKKYLKEMIEENLKEIE